MLKRSIQDAFSTNCIAAVEVSKPVISGSVTRKEATDATSAIQRTAPALLSRPSASRRPPLPGHQTHDTQDHDQRIPVQGAGLDQAHQAGDAAHRARGAVDQDAVDDALVAGLPQAGAEGAGRAGQHALAE